MTALSIRSEHLSKSYSIPHPHAPRWREYSRSPRTAWKRPRRLEVAALSDVSFEVAEGEVFGIIGANGAGKSTLLKILSRITTPTSGRATIRGRVASLLEVGTGFHPDLTGRENVYLNGMLLGMTTRQVTQVFDQIAAFADIGAYVDTPIKRYSSGMQLRLAFAVAAHLAADTMIVDEVLAVGDAEFQAKCTGAMHDAARRGRTTLFVSHNMVAVQNLCSRALMLRAGKVVRVGPASEVVREYLRGLGSRDGSMHGYEASAPPTGPVSIRRASIRAVSGGPPIQGEDAIIDLELETRAATRGVQLVLWLSTVEGDKVTALSNGDYRGEWDLRPGRYRAVSRLQAVRLLPRRYLLSLQLVLGWSEIIESLPDAVSFEVVPGDVLGTGVPLDGNRGVTWLPAHFTLERLAAPSAAEV